ncbi:MAG: ribonuclease P protein component [Candidatus Daviesbacteria bacterium]|nr:ribonuclease P protein component [Candidatus Daviesbacteria bacterium]
MLSRDKRLNLKISFSFVIKGQKTENSFYKIFFRQGDVVQPKVGIALKKEYFKLAVDRNRARRLTSKAMESLYPLLKEKTNLILMPKAEILKQSSEELTEFLKKELKRIDLISN